jgi:DNA-directed RNA polymerase beta subunit
MQKNIEPEEELPKGVILRDFDDFNTLRNQIFDGVKNSMIKSFPVNYGSVRMELHDVDYDERDDVPVSQQKQMLLENKYITKKLRGTVKLFDNTNDQLLEEKRLSLMKVPYLTNRGTFIHGGNEYASIMQSRLLPGVYTRRQANGELETQFNVKPGTGIGFRVGFEPETTQYRVKISQANLHLYSLLKDLGTNDKELEKAWGPEIFRANQMKYDARVFDKAYDRLVPARQKKLDKSREDKMTSVRNALEAAQIHARVAQKNLPNMFDPKVASQWEAQWQGKQAAEKLASERIDSIPFEPDLTPKEAVETFIDEDVLEAVEKEPTLRDHADVFDPIDKKFHEVYVPDIWEIVKNRKAEKIDLSKIWGGSEDSPGFDETRVEAADTSYPIILDSYTEGDGFHGGLVDGRHRKIKLDRKGETQADVIKLTDEEIAQLLDKNKNKKSAADMHALMQARKHSAQAKEEYKKKTSIMAAALARYPEEFIVDQDGRMSGITHMPTGFRIHVPREVIPKGVKRVFQEDEEEIKEASESDFIPDYKPEDIQDAYNSIYGHYGPRLASMEKWPSEWIKSDVDPMGWLQWYEQYKAGRRSEDDDRQIKRWKSFKARHGSQFKKNPTPRRAFALRNWAIDPLKMIEDEEARGQLAEAMENYKEDAWNKYHKSNE